MTSICELTGKHRRFGNNVSHSKRRTHRDWKPNIQKKTFLLDGKKITMHLSTQAIRILKKKGIITAFSLVTHKPSS